MVCRACSVFLAIRWNRVHKTAAWGQAMTRIRVGVAGCRPSTSASFYAATIRNCGMVERADDAMAHKSGGDAF